MDEILKTYGYIFRISNPNNFKGSGFSFFAVPPTAVRGAGTFFLLRLCEFLKKGLDKLAKIWALRAS